jgi:hypothetical protein
MLKPLTVVVTVQYLVRPWHPPYQDVAEWLEIGVGQAHREVMRARELGLLSPSNEVSRRRLLEALQSFGILIPAKNEGIGRGIPTAHGAPPLSLEMAAGDEPVPVWEHPEGTVRGLIVAPVHSSVPETALKCERFYRIFALADAVRMGRQREVELAKRLLEAEVMA